MSTNCWGRNDAFNNALPSLKRQCRDQRHAYPHDHARRECTTLLHHDPTAPGWPVSSAPPPAGSTFVFLPSPAPSTCCKLLTSLNGGLFTPAAIGGRYSPRFCIRPLPGVGIPMRREGSADGLTKLLRMGVVAPFAVPFCNGAGDCGC